ncbi:Transcriptional regulator MraZ [Trichinella spiralis]|uniref:Transcriptional regulator MraZ n=1 Tax=Trichinella spiralis TaxID=6334 RepID=A0ABR3KU73_TRISP
MILQSGTTSNASSQCWQTTQGSVASSIKLTPASNRAEHFPHPCRLHGPTDPLLREPLRRRVSLLSTTIFKYDINKFLHCVVLFGVALQYYTDHLDVEREALQSYAQIHLRQKKPQNKYADVELASSVVTT